MNLTKITPTDGDFDESKRSKFEDLIKAIGVDLAEDEELVVSPVLIYSEFGFSGVDYSQLELELMSPVYFRDEDTEKEFISEIENDVSIISLPLEWTPKQIEELFPDGDMVYFTLSSDEFEIPMEK